MGWLCQRKHPEVISGGKTIIMTDLEAEKVVMFQHKHYMSFFMIFAFILPTVIPNILWGESLVTAYFISGSTVLLSSFIKLPYNVLWLVVSSEPKAPT